MMDVPLMVMMLMEEKERERREEQERQEEETRKNNACPHCGQQMINRSIPANCCQPTSYSANCVPYGSPNCSNQVTANQSPIIGEVDRR
jgi:predicted RNA-binding Zn-ribbon protein involved in translation (DUF1610 family)